jgi:hypothetical protein
VISAEAAFKLINKGNKARAVASTHCNEHSSRSHAILTVHVESKVSHEAGPSTETDLDGASGSADDGELRLGKMHLVDLAGSERLSMSKAEGETLVETQNINLSLSAIGSNIYGLKATPSLIGCNRGRTLCTFEECFCSNPEISCWQQRSDTCTLSGPVP